MFESYKNVLKRGGSHLVTSLRAIIFAVLTGIVLGFVGTAFYYGMQTVTAMRLDHPWLKMCIRDRVCSCAGNVPAFTSAE